MNPPVPTGSFRRQIVVLTVCVTAFAMVVLTVLVQLLLAAQTSRDVDRVLEDRADAVAGSTTSGSPEDPLTVPDAELDRGVVVYDADGALVAGQAPAGQAEAYAELSRTGETRLRDLGDDRRVLARPFTTTAGTTGVVVVDEVLTPYEEAEFYALLVSLVTGGLATAAAGALAAWVATRALRPVAVLAGTATEWSEHDLLRRFDLGPPTNELTALAGTLDNLLDRVTAAIRSEQRLTSELAHELRTPLTTIQGTADLALLGEDLTEPAREHLEEISAAAHRMTHTIATLLELARTERTVADSAVASLVDVVDEVVRSTPADVAVEVEVPDLRVGAPHALAVRALAPVLANAVRFATTAVRVRVDGATAPDIALVVEDDGPGILGDPERIFEPGTTTGGGSGGGLGLALARRVARSCGGDVEVTRAAGPTRVTVRLPRV
ncbi:Signal transduction histidine-protein kinase ArlS [Nocardioides dokdonensis FR1436]|uniref:histidine kinase n=1 Tax=Nocardioides dokdonensis FR1436 TaxID=1300347 RepID=A0A1A9GQA9_9ACTN|nr:HAMP domain-containing sensor histidine kinase [Nocardioides dokdonensis]ANH40468.1 Signal transduction histidine-protein kinase ArlS [Nocardioides dokdonensis FR1436]